MEVLPKARQIPNQMLTMCVFKHTSSDSWIEVPQVLVLSQIHPNIPHSIHPHQICSCWLNRNPQSLRKYGYTPLLNSPLSPLYEYLASHKEKLSIEKVANGIILCYRQQWSIFPLILDIEKVYTGYVPSPWEVKVDSLEFKAKFSNTASLKLAQVTGDSVLSKQTIGHGGSLL